MMPKTCILKLKRYAGWSTRSERSDGYLKVIAMGIAVMLTLVIVFVSIADYALYSTRRSLIARGIDYAVCAAIQEIDVPASNEGLSEGFDSRTGNVLTNNIKLNESIADNAFFGTLEANTGIIRSDIVMDTLIAYIYPSDDGINYIIKKDSQRVEGFVTSPDKLETAINNTINTFWNTSAPDLDRHTIYVNGNPSTNEFKEVPYFLVFIKDHQINGLFRKRTATFVGFAGAKLERGD